MAKRDTAETDAPRDVEPHHQQRQNGKRTVDGVVTADEQLAVDIEILHRAKEGAGEQRGEIDAAPANGDEGDVLEHQSKHTAHHQGFDDPENDGRAVVDQREVGQIVEEFQHHHPHSAEEEDGENEKHDESQVREGKTEDAARSIDTPHGVKSALDVVDQRNEGESQHQEADSDHNVVLCARNVGVGEVHQLGDDVIGQAHVITELGFEIAVETKTAPHREEQRQEGNDGEHGGVSQRGDVREEVVAVDLLPKAANHLRRTAAQHANIEQSGLHRREIFR